MTDQDRTRFVKAILVLRGAIPNAPALTEEQLEIYFAVLKGQPIAAVEAATEAAMQRNSPFFPAAGELLALCTGNTTSQAQVEWLAVLKEVRRVGYMGTPTKLSPATMEVIQGLWGSWSHLCQTLPGEGNELLGWGKRFESSYNALAERREHPAYLGRGEAKTMLSSLMRQLAAHRGQDGARR